jgi:hypothetical protein|tara:strand:- start:607 stop:792 length:186 start_codon:yes stop_codon:yes gene_type:complete
MRKKILAFSDKITSGHEKLFNYLAKKSKSSIWFTFLLLFMALYEVVEHFVIPALLIWWGLS